MLRQAICMRRNVSPSKTRSCVNPTALRTSGKERRAPSISVKTRRKLFVGKEFCLQGFVKRQNGVLGEKRCYLAFRADSERVRTSASHRIIDNSVRGYNLPFVSFACLPPASHNARPETPASRRISKNSTRDLTPNQSSAMLSIRNHKTLEGRGHDI